MEKDIGKIKKNSFTDIIVRLDDFGGKPGITIREFTTSDKYTGFTKSGTRISVENFPVFKEIINSINLADIPKTSAVATAPAEKKSIEITEKKSPKQIAKEKQEKPAKPVKTPKNEEEVRDEDLL